MLNLVLVRWENSIGIQGIQGIRMDKTKLLCIGHRGAMGHAPENTLLSFKKALELGAACVEADVYHVDGNLVVFR